MIKTKEKLLGILKQRGIPVAKFLMELGIYSGDFYKAINGKKPFYSAWRKRISEKLGVAEKDLFDIDELLEIYNR